MQKNFFYLDATGQDENDHIKNANTEYKIQNTEIRTNKYLNSTGQDENGSIENANTDELHKHDDR